MGLHTAGPRVHRECCAELLTFPGSLLGAPPPFQHSQPKGQGTYFSCEHHSRSGCPSEMIQKWDHAPDSQINIHCPVDTRDHHGRDLAPPTKWNKWWSHLGKRENDPQTRIYEAEEMWSLEEAQNSEIESQVLTTQHCVPRLSHSL